MFMKISRMTGRTQLNFFPSSNSLAELMIADFNDSK